MVLSGVLACIAAVQIESSLGRPACWMEERWRCGLTDVSKNPADGLGIGQEGNEREGSTARRADQGECLVDAGQQGGPLGRPGGGGGAWTFGNFVRSRLTCGGCRGLGDGSLVGKNICPSSRVFGLCPGSDKGPQGDIGSKGPMVAVLIPGEHVFGVMGLQ